MGFIVCEVEVRLWQQIVVYPTGYLSDMAGGAQKLQKMDASRTTNPFYYLLAVHF